ncbi:Clp protease ClpP [Vibrio vulnificus]|nr:Clp protease ClpP [Vibrio vulnificus]
MTKKSKPNWYKLRASAEQVTLFLYGDIGRWEISAQVMLQELFVHSGKDLTIRFHTDGGEVDEGWAIYAALKDYKGTITGIVDSVCASISTAILMACDVRLIRPTARLMYHECHGIAYGRAAEMRARADEAEIINDQMMGVFAKVTGKSEEEIRATVESADCWLSAREAVEQGFCTGLYEDSADPLEASLSDAPKLKHLKAMNAPEPLVAKWQAEEDSLESESEPQETPDEPKLQAGTDSMTPEEFKAKEQARRQAIKALFEKHPKATALKAQCLDDLDCGHEQAATRLLAYLAEPPTDPETNEPSTPTTPAPAESTQTGLTASAAKGHLANYFGARLKACKWDENNPYRHMSATEALRAHAVYVGDSAATQMDRKKLVAHAFTNNTHSLGEIIETHVNALIINEVANLESWHTRIVNRQPMQFGTNDILVMNDLGKPGVKTEGGKFTQVKLKATGDTAVLATHGFEIQVSRELIMSDKFDFITKQVQKAVRSCAQVPADSLIALLKDNPKLKDGKPLFSKALGNEFEGPLNAETLADMSGSMADAKTSEGNPLYLKPDLYLTSNRRAKTVNSLMKAEMIKEEPNEAFEAFAEAKGLADLAGEDFSFAFAHSDHISFVEGYHEDAEGVQVETKEEWKSDGATIRIYIDSVIKPVDRKGVQKHVITAAAEPIAG